ncbi:MULTISPECIES: hypothetical protein [Rhodococcus]|jgi:hypothetical protein|uniref:Uncharacterized protein n=1 Tax=Rhodococcus jostii (strain RHA1) TaxID=101510 RepID=Q0RYA4_RHOJR|nr:MULTISPECIES: hypothetical protein [Rhodococcus]ABG99732.1 hypothetical protein RHA1_ro08688 [Rhodococcus jostii RHA1]QQZ18895.1 hypothetical protein GO592_35895 [Rhodococcus sp. 21391]
MTTTLRRLDLHFRPAGTYRSGNPEASPNRRLTGRLGCLLAVLALVLAPLLVDPLSPVAAASGFACDEVPAPEYPKGAFPGVFDATSQNRPDNGVTGYTTYGWAGLQWYTYDLGCGMDLVRAPGAVTDTDWGNRFLTIGKSLAAAAFWLDDQTKTGQAAEDAGVAPAMEQFDQVVSSISNGMLGIYGLWLGIGLTAAASIMLWHALKSNAAGVTKSMAVGGAALALGALLIGAPQQAIRLADDTFGAVITDTQNEMLSVSGSGKGPRDVLLDDIFLDDWRKGWFGPNYRDNENQLGPKLRDALAFSYEEQQQIENAPDSGVESDLKAKKEGIFRDDIVKPLNDDYGLSYYTFQGKDSGRTGIGFMAMVKVGMPSLLWIGASVLKLIALLAIRLAILFAPIWIPLAAAHAGTLMRVCRMIASAYMWGVAGSVIVALYLLALVKLYVTDNGQIDGSWRLWFMVILTLVCWFIMRPFKRVSQTFTQNRAGALNRKARHAQTSMKQKVFKGASAVIGGPAGAMVEEGVGALRKKTKDGFTDEDSDINFAAPARPEGRELNQRRRHEADQTRIAAHRKMDLLQRLADSRKESQDARHMNLAMGGKHREQDTANTRVGRGRRTALQALEASRSGGGARRGDTPRVSETWDGGAGSAIAPTRVFTPTRKDTSPGNVPAASAPASISAPPRSNTRLYAPSLTPEVRTHPSESFT